MKQNSAPPPGLRTPLQFLKGVGPERAKLLAKKEVTTVEAALFYVPLRHEDGTRLTPFRTLQPGEVQTCSGVLVGLTPPPPRRFRVPFTAMLRDESGYATASWFGGGYLGRVLKRGQRLVLHGKGMRYKGAINLQHPDYEIVEAGEDERLHTGRLVAGYSTTEGPHQRAPRPLMWTIVEPFRGSVAALPPRAVPTPP